MKPQPLRPSKKTGHRQLVLVYANSAGGLAPCRKDEVVRCSTCGAHHVGPMLGAACPACRAVVRDEEAMPMVS